jgi:RNA-directed DNA polymerase
MRTYKGLYRNISSWENLLEAARKASLGKRYSPNVIQFNKHLQYNLARLKYELQSASYRPGPYAEFYIYESKKRKISAAPLL